jgi:hypothetical protein
VLASLAGLGGLEADFTFSAASSGADVTLDFLWLRLLDAPSPSLRSSSLFFFFFFFSILAALAAAFAAAAASSSVSLPLLSSWGLSS